MIQKYFTNEPAAKTCSMFTCRRGSEWIQDALSRPDPKPLWMSLWYEGEVSCLFADTNVGKSIYAIQIAVHVSQSQPVLYFDFEMTDKQFQMRYTDDNTKEVYPFNENFYRVEFSRSGAVDFDMQSIIDHIEYEVDNIGAKVIIIDNITWICNSAESGDSAGELMQLLIDLKKRRGLSILVVAHTPKRSIYSPLTQNTLAGSKRLANFMDSMFAIGLSRPNLPHGRYVKQIKVRNSEMLYGEENVILCEIVKTDNNIHFEHTGYGCEQEQLGMPDEETAFKLEKRLKLEDLIRQGIPHRIICRDCHVSSATISKIKKKMSMVGPNEV